MRAFKLTTVVSAVAVLALSSIGTTSASPAFRSGSKVTSVDCAVSDWTYGACNKKTNKMKGTRTITVSRVGNGAKCPTLTQTLPCYCETTDWADASACDSTGHKTMMRTVTSTKTCTPVDLSKQVTCPVDCVSSYKTDAACNTDGSQTQTLVITTQAANGGTACPTDTTRTVPGVCPAVDCVSNYKTDAACEADGSQIQQLEITTPAAYGGAACPTKTSRKVKHYCAAVDCELTSWTYTNCKQRANGSWTARRTRSILSEAQYCGTSCNRYTLTETVKEADGSVCASVA